MDTRLFEYELPAARIARFPAARRGGSRLLCVRPRLTPRLLEFSQVGEVLRAGDVLVANDTKVVPARLAARKASGGKAEVLLERVLGGGRALVQVRANKPIRVGEVLSVSVPASTDDATAETAPPPSPPPRLQVIEPRDDFWVIDCQPPDAAALFRRHGALPLPPYLDRAPTDDDWARYQTVYARTDGAVAAPTAGLHFDRPLLAALAAAGVGWASITLHIGAATFQPVRSESAHAHRMHREWVEVDRAACRRIAAARAGGGRVVAVGTTVVRALETAAQSGRLAPYRGDTELFILPGHRFRAVDALITNFHLPRSTLLMLVCAFAGRAETMRAYHHAIAQRLRFYSYGDAMFAERQ